jgi:hypothetical protein
MVQLQLLLLLFVFAVLLFPMLLLQQVLNESCMFVQ